MSKIIDFTGYSFGKLKDMIVGFYAFEVIDTIYDNPELLGLEKD
jgi:hypothetical protein